MITTVFQWDEKKGDLVLGFSRGGSTPPTLYDGHGNAVAAFPIPDPEIKDTAWTSGMKGIAQHADMLGGPTEEIVVWNEQWICVYANGDPALAGTASPKIRRPNKRLYNYTYYIGMP